MKVGDLIAAIDESVPFDGAGAWDRVGLQVGGSERPVTSVAVCHEVTPGVIDQVRANDVDVLVSYHPLLFAPTTKFVEGSDASGRALELASAGVNLIVVHTALDVAIPGTADALLAAIGLDAASPFAPVDDEGGGEIGRIAHLASPQRLGLLALAVGDATGSPVRFNMPAETTISSVGVVPGSGDSFIGAALGKVDCYITGDVSHHGANSARNAGMAIIDAGHVPSERAGVQSLYALIVELVSGAAMLEDDAHPWRA